MMFLRHNTSGETVGTDGGGYVIGGGADEWTEIAATPAGDGPPESLHIVDGQIAALPRRLSFDEVVALYTPAEVARIFAAPQLQVTQLLIALRCFGVVLGSVEHTQGTALVAGLGLLDAPERAARILAGERPI